MKLINDDILKWLIDTGLDSKRAELYLTALSYGKASAKELADSVGMRRTAIYDNLQVLEERGYVKTVRQGKRKVFIPLSPKELYKKFNNQRDQLKDLLPDFLSLYAAEDGRPFVRLFEGPFAAREVYEDILTHTKKEYLYFSPSKFTLQTVDRVYIEKWIGRRVFKGIHSRSLRVKSKVLINDPVFNDEQKYLRQIRYLPEYVDLKSSIYIYEQNVAVISTKKEEVAFIIHSADLAFSFQQIFEFLWAISLRS